MRRRNDPISEVLQNEKNARQSIWQQFTFALAKLELRAQQSRKELTADPLDVRTTTCIASKMAAKKRAELQRTERERRNSEAIVAQLKEKAPQNPTAITRKPSMYEAMMNHARAYQKLLERKGVLESEENGGRSCLEGEQFDVRRKIVRLKLRELEQFKKVCVRSAAAQAAADPSAAPHQPL